MVFFGQLSRLVILFIQKDEEIVLTEASLLFDYSSFVPIQQTCPSKYQF